MRSALCLRHASARVRRGGVRSVLDHARVRAHGCERDRLPCRHRRRGSGVLVLALAHLPWATLVWERRTLSGTLHGRLRPTTAAGRRRRQHAARPAPAAPALAPRSVPEHGLRPDASAAASGPLPSSARGGQDEQEAMAAAAAAAAAARLAEAGYSAGLAPASASALHLCTRLQVRAREPAHVRVAPRRRMIAAQCQCAGTQPALASWPPSPGWPGGRGAAGAQLHMRRVDAPAGTRAGCARRRGPARRAR